MRMAPSYKPRILYVHPIQTNWQPYGPFETWYLTKPSFADIGAEMRTLWALATILALQAEALDLLSPPPVLQQLPVGNLPVRRRNVYNYPTVRRAARTAENRPQPQKRECYPMARYFMSGDKLRDCK